MNNIFKQIARAMYQIIVVGIILLPLRIIIGLIGLLLGLTTVVDGREAFFGYYRNLYLGLCMAYPRRANWVKYGWRTADPNEIKLEEGTAE